ncbi:ComEC/Rec2 family competence protein [Bifidobacterium sp. SO4]|uniref:ComEC/Rec2 family competence protein n=1 Tax=Bifidobacterium sp. SO4 TaxID=2809030 RepID=UPI001BDD324D|nr:ComEC/Rec2 family competence protein [Bifidobacterium sp. SO4]MBT1170270.1 ComEC/Rec2 family competence protein [Bifidobacterium sp. SO4]
MDWMLREQGSRDWRLLPVALTMWAASLAAHLLFDRWSAAAESMASGMVGGVGASVNGSGEAIRNAGMTPSLGNTGAAVAGVAVRAMSVAIAVLLLAMLGVALRSRIRWSGTVAVCLAVACIGGITATASDIMAWRDPASIWARTYGRTTQVSATVTAPVVASDQREYDCQADARLDGIIAGNLAMDVPSARNGTATAANVGAHTDDAAGLPGTMLKSNAKVRVYAEERYCAKLNRGAVYHLTGTLEQAEYGRMPLWLLIEGEEPVIRVKGPPWHRAAVEHMQRSFFHVTERLSDQGRVLVPGLTMGVLGQDYVNVTTDSTGGATTGETGMEHRTAAVNETYANTLEDRFRRSGIMHLMAVSGGHFVLLADMVRRLCMRFLVGRKLSASLMAFVYVLLALLMFPGDSVTRALVMGLLGAAAYGIGRRTQSLSALSWTVIGVLVLDPDMSQSYGFALSSAAVLGIVLFAGVLGGILVKLLPESIAQMTAMTVGAQAFTLPIQILMEPELPLLSVPANLLVSPFVGFATVTGLMALACAWCVPWLAGMLAWVASLGTLVMERVAMRLGGGEWTALPWPDGVTGALLMLLAECGLAMIAVMTARFVRYRLTQDTGLGVNANASTALEPDMDGVPGERFGSARRVRMTLWWQETLRLLHPAKD